MRAAAGVVALWAAGGVAAAELVVVHEAPGAVDASPYLGVRPSAGVARRAAAAAGRSLPTRVTWLAAYPMRPEPLRPGSGRTVVREGVRGVVFVVGASAGDLEWLRRRAQALRGRDAVGYLVEAPTARAFERLAAAAAELGVVVVPAQGAAVAEMFGIEEFPVALVARSAADG